MISGITIGGSVAAAAFVYTFAGVFGALATVAVGALVVWSFSINTSKRN